MLWGRTDILDRNLGLTRVGVLPGKYSGGREGPGVQGVCRRGIIVMKSRLGRERNEVMRRVIEKVVVCMECRLKCKE